MIEAYPLKWPRGWQRAEHKKQAKFDTPLVKARDNLLYEMRLLGGKSIIINSNIPIRKDGLPYATYREPMDPGVAVYFELGGQNQCIPCDCWNAVVDNLHAIGLTVAAIRGIKRWGTKEMVSATFKGFQALPEHTHEDTVTPASRVDHFAGCTTIDDVKERRRNLAKDLHPDKGGDPEEFTEMMKQYDKKLMEINNKR